MHRRAAWGIVSRGGCTMDQATQRVVSRPGLVSRRQAFRVDGSEHRTASRLYHGDFDLYEAGDVGDHAIHAAALSGDAHELSFSESLQHAAPSLLASRRRRYR